VLVGLAVAQCSNYECQVATAEPVFTCQSGNTYECPATMGGGPVCVNQYRANHFSYTTSPSATAFTISYSRLNPTTATQGSITVFSLGFGSCLGQIFCHQFNPSTTLALNLTVSGLSPNTTYIIRIGHFDGCLNNDPWNPCPGVQQMTYNFCVSPLAYRQDKFTLNNPRSIDWGIRATSAATVEVQSNASRTLEVLDLYGRILQTWQIEREIVVLSHSLPPGLYIVRDQMDLSWRRIAIP
ncbi:MAG: T9SS type A sorting domain-containing protein, partial [Bacteroidia bacterium]|nr:T9SS type A sorting domain-containing protein [Bacteroidia bacterium]